MKMEHNVALIGSSGCHCARRACGVGSRFVITVSGDPLLSQTAHLWQWAVNRVRGQLHYQSAICGDSGDSGADLAGGGGGQFTKKPIASQSLKVYIA